MRLSVIVTTYNRPDALSQVLKGLAGQNRRADEVLVADDGSGPETARLIQSIQSSTNMELIHVWHEDLGFRAAAVRNKAILQSKGDYIVLLDGDCIPDPHFLADHERLAEQDRFFQGKRILVEKVLSEKFTAAMVRRKLELIGLTLAGKLSNAHHLIRLPAFPARSSTRLKGIRTCNMGFFRQDIFAVNGFNEGFTGWGREDSELAVRFFKYGLKKKEHPFMAVCFHLWHAENDRNRLNINEQLLKQAINKNEYYCEQGLVRS